MKLQTLRLFGFQSFGAKVTELPLDDITYLIGPNGARKDAALQALVITRHNKHLEGE